MSEQPVRSKTPSAVPPLRAVGANEKRRSPAPGSRWRIVRRATFWSRHTCLFLACLALYLGVPLLEETGSSLFTEDLFTLCLMLTSLIVLSQFRALTILGTSLSVILILSTWLEQYYFRAQFDLLEGMLLPAFYGTVLVVVIGNLLREHDISLDHILGAVAGYFILGFFWAEIYDLLLLFDPEAIASNVSATLSKSQMFYFSFSTLVTIGYGDIVPHAGLARNTAVLEGISGQLYLAILIARLVGLHLHRTVSMRRTR